MSQRARRQAATAARLPFAPKSVAPAGRLLVGDAASLRPRRPALRWHWGRYLVAVTAAYCAWLGHGEWVAYHRLAAEEAALAAQRTQLLQQRAALQSAIAYAGTDAYIQAQAGQLFGMVQQGEVPMAPLPESGSGQRRP